MRNGLSSSRTGRMWWSNLFRRKSNVYGNQVVVGESPRLSKRPPTPPPQVDPYIIHKVAKSG